MSDDPHNGLGVSAEFAKTPALRSSHGHWTFKLDRDPWNQLRLTDAKGTRYGEVVVVPMYPVAAPKEWVSILSKEGEELVCLKNLDSLNSSERQLLEEELSFREFVPQILKVHWVSGTQEPCEWDVETNHGRTRFVLNAEEDVRRVTAWTVHFIDANGCRFRVDDIRKLDSRSRGYVEWYV
ncbi:MAG: DUF1854 domain-containing protein [Planctomycetota bacterium]|jgi:hypothetical protein